MITKFKYLILSFLVALSLISANYAYASTPAEEVLFTNEKAYPKGIIETIKQSIEESNAKIVLAAKHILYTMLLASILLIGFKCISGDNFTNFFAELFKFIFIAGVIFWAIEHSGDIIATIEKIPQFIMDTGGKRPEEDIFNILADQILSAGARIDAASWYDKPTMTIVSVISIAFITIILINYILLMIKMYFVLNIGVLALAIGGCSIHNQYAMNYLKECLSYTLQLITLIIIIKVLITYTNEFLPLQNDVSTILACILFTVVTAIFAVLAEQIPNAVGSLIGGSSSSGISPMSAAKTAAAATTAAATAINNFRHRNDNKPENNPVTQQLQRMNENLAEISNDMAQAQAENTDRIVEAFQNRNNQDGGNQDGGNQDGGNQDGSNQDGGNQDGGNQDGGNQDGGNQDGGNQDGGNQDGGNQDGGNNDGSNQDGGSQDGSNNDGDSQDGSNNDGSNQDGGNNDGGSQDGGNNDGSNQDGGNQDGGNQDGSNQDGGDNDIENKENEGKK